MTGVVGAPYSVIPRRKSGVSRFQFLNHGDGETVRSTGVETSPLNLRASVVNFLDAPHGGGA